MLCCFHVHRTEVSQTNCQFGGKPQPTTADLQFQPNVSKGVVINKIQEHQTCILDERENLTEKYNLTVCELERVAGVL